MKRKIIHIGITANALASLINNRQLHAVDFQCLDPDSKRAVWELLLNAVKFDRNKNYSPK
jgi:hypothetical protein